MGGLAEKVLFKSGTDKIKKEIPSELWKLSVKDIDGNNKFLSEFTENKKAFIFINVACKWGLTSEHYTQLVQLYDKLSGNGLQILAFPCGQFANQEFEKESEIKEFVSNKFKVTFPMFSRIEVNGENMHPIYAYLKKNTPELTSKEGLKNIPWNFGKFLVNREGKVIKFYGPKINPVEMEKDIMNLLI